MAKYSQVVVLTGVFLTAVLLSFMMMTQEGFAAGKKGGKKGKKGGAAGAAAGTGKKGTGKKGTGKKGTGKKGTGKKGTGKKGTGKKGTGKKGAGKKGTGKRAAGAGKRRTGKRMIGTSDDTGVPSGMRFSELVSTLLGYSARGGAGGAPYGAAYGGGIASAAGGLAIANEVRQAVRDELQSNRLGNSSVTNSALADRSTTPLNPDSPSSVSGSTSVGGGGPVKVFIYPE